MVFVKYRCPACKKVFVTDTTPHTMKYCPNCKNCAVDLEETYCRFMMHEGKMPEFIEEFKPPWFGNEEEYHSAFLSWLNDSDEEYMLFKDGPGLYAYLVKGKQNAI